MPLAEFCRERGFELRFIEFMPLEADQIWQREQVLSADELLSILGRAGLLLEPIPAEDPNAPASEYRYVDDWAHLELSQVLPGRFAEPVTASASRRRESSAIAFSHLVKWISKERCVAGLMMRRWPR